MMPFQRFLQPPDDNFFLFGPRGEERYLHKGILVLPVGQFLRALVPNIPFPF